MRVVVSWGPDWRGLLEKIAYIEFQRRASDYGLRM